MKLRNFSKLQIFSILFLASFSHNENNRWKYHETLHYNFNKMGLIKPPFQEASLINPFLLTSIGMFAKNKIFLNFPRRGEGWKSIIKKLFCLFPILNRINKAKSFKMRWHRMNEKYWKSFTRNWVERQKRELQTCEINEEGFTEAKVWRSFFFCAKNFQSNGFAHCTKACTYCVTGWSFLLSLSLTRYYCKLGWEMSRSEKKLNKLMKFNEWQLLLSHNLQRTEIETSHLTTLSDTFQLMLLTSCTMSASVINRHLIRSIWDEVRFYINFNWFFYLFILI